MQRAIVTPAILAPTALAELKQWLAISIDDDDAPLTALLRASLDTCEAFTGAMPLVAECEEQLPACGGWQTLATRPVQAISAVATVDAAGVRTALPAAAYQAAIGLDGIGQVNVTAAAPGSAPVQRLAVTFSAGLATDWDSLPDGLRHGIVRLAAHQHREREGSGADPLPPASVAALWRPWRRMRLS